MAFSSIHFLLLCSTSCLGKQHDLLCTDMRLLYDVEPFGWMIAIKHCAYCLALAMR